MPEGFETRPLTDSDVVNANAAWQFSHPGSLFYLQRLARLNASCGIFTKNGTELVSSGFQCVASILIFFQKASLKTDCEFPYRVQTGPVGTMYTNPEYRNRGFGTLIAKIIFKQIGESGYGVTACVKEKNASSRAMFEKIGCQIIDEVHWISMECAWSDDTDFIKESHNI